MNFKTADVGIEINTIVNVYMYAYNVCVYIYIHICILRCFSHVPLFATLWTGDSSGKNTGVGCHAFSRGSS